MPAEEIYANYTDQIKKKSKAPNQRPTILLQVYQ
jgi:hypothetical protein